ncbi:hypothetical protein LDG_5713 [Legionella drancourtii LLAP12]|uniref:Uncharacterized protein n=1 Tax=Legionella drancourtii LLAP12 TaxID=658187 RepID=G9EKH9_9GAMM|nr:hypothetical protein LDG_5713 [Legionella drancourtii LLAP12]
MNELGETAAFSRLQQQQVPARNHHIFSVDSSKINVPHELLDTGYKAPNKKQYYPQ